MRTNARGPNKSPQNTDEQITIDARDVLAGKWNEIRLGDL